MTGAPLELRCLGELSVERDGKALALPQSRKTRALLAYLAITGRPHRRARLCDLLWDVTHDPRGALRWSLSKLRPIVNDEGVERIVAGRDTVEFRPERAVVDVLEVRRQLARGAEQLSLHELGELAGRFRGELLEGMELGDFHEFQAWCLAEREEARRLQATVLAALRDRLGERPDEALPHARALSQIDPLDESNHVALVRLLVATKRRSEAELQVESTRRLFHELRGEAPRALEAAWRELQAASSGTGGAEPSVATPIPLSSPETIIATISTRPFVPLVGRHAQLERIEEELDRVAKQGRMRVLVFEGEPGQGKSRLLQELRRRARADRAAVLRGKAYEAEEDRPYGPWIDALRGLPRERVEQVLGGELALLLPELARALPDDPSRDRLFRAVVELISNQADAGTPVVITLDDAQWLDESSAVLLHYVARMNRSRPVLIGLGVRGGELADNPQMLKVIRSLRRDGVLTSLELEPLTREEVLELARQANPSVDAARVAADSGGNPLFAMELARALEWTRDELPGQLSGIVRDRVERLSAEAADVLRWGAVLGPILDVPLLAELVSVSADGLVNALEELERHALVTATDDPAHPRGAYAISHDLVRLAVYGDLSGPRRRLMHWNVATALGKRDDPDGALAGQVAHHASLGGDAALAVRAYVGSARRCLRLFADAQARTCVRRGRRLVGDLADPDRTRLEIELLDVSLGAGWPDDVEDTVRELQRLAARALDLDLRRHARLAFHLISHLQWKEGDWGDALKATLHAERVSRGEGDGERVLAMAEAARCLVELERDLPQAEALLLEAAAVSERAGVQPSALDDARGLLRWHQGRLDEARDHFVRARELADAGRERWDEFFALEHLIGVLLQEGALDEAAPLCEALEIIGESFREGAELPYARVLSALVACGREPGWEALDVALSALRGADAKVRLAFALTRASDLALAREDYERARDYSTEALRHATTLGRSTEMALARLALIRSAVARGDTEAAESERAALRELGGSSLAWHVRERVKAVLQPPGDS